MIDVPVNNKINKANLHHRMEAGWSDLQSFLDTLTQKQLMVPTDAGGWTVKDHLIHLAIWEEGLTALLNHRSQAVGMRVDRAMWEQGIDTVNALIQRRYRDMPLHTVMETLNRCHQRLLKTLETFSDDDLLLPYSYFDSASDNDEPIIAWIVANSFGHYADHLPWIAAIARQGS